MVDRTSLRKIKLRRLSRKEQNFPSDQGHNKATAETTQENFEPQLVIVCKQQISPQNKPTRAKGRVYSVAPKFDTLAQQADDTFRI